MKLDIHLKLFKHYFHFYRRKVGTKLVFSIYHNGNSIYQVVSNGWIQNSESRKKWFK